MSRKSCPAFRTRSSAFLHEEISGIPSKTLKTGILFLLAWVSSGAFLPWHCLFLVMSGGAEWTYAEGHKVPRHSPASLHCFVWVGVLICCAFSLPLPWHPSVSSRLFTWACSSWPCLYACLRLLIRDRVYWAGARSSWWLGRTSDVSRSCCSCWRKLRWRRGKCPSRCSPTAARNTRCTELRSAWPCLIPAWWYKRLNFK